MKKIPLISLASIALTLSPIAFAVSYQESKTVAQSDTQPKLGTSYNNPLGIDFSNVSEDGIYFVKNTFDGTILDPKTNVENTAGNNELIPMPSGGDYFSQENVVELGDEDKFYVVFDKDDSDGMDAAHLTDEFFFTDTSYASTPENDAWNINQGSQIISKQFWKEINIPFKNGMNVPWVGSQSNHMAGTWSEALANYTSSVDDDNGVIQATNTYYNTHSKQFFPVYQSEGTFTYEQVADNAFAFTYQFLGANITAAGFKLMKNDGSNVSSPINYYTFSVGDELEHQSYSQSLIAKFFAKKSTNK